MNGKTGYLLRVTCPLLLLFHVTHPTLRRCRGRFFIKIQYVGERITFPVFWRKRQPPPSFSLIRLGTQFYRGVGTELFGRFP